jgi:hypothetical protein
VSCSCRGTGGRGGYGECSVKPGLSKIVETAGCVSTVRNSAFAQTIDFIVAVIVSKVARGLLLQRVGGFLWYESYVDYVWRGDSGRRESSF